MRKFAPLLALCLSVGCSTAPPPSARKAETSVPPKITQFYAVKPKLGLGDEGELCYGVENATSVWLSPPRQDLPTALTHCVTVTPSKTTTYQLTAQGGNGQSVTQEITVAVGAATPHISEVRVSTLEAKAGDTVSLCYTVRNAVSVRIDPIGFKGGAGSKQCATATPKRTTTYVVSATGADGETDSEKVTVTVH